uniref:Uncharacterized protein n=1 Tax=Arundo donax TaxID=35708 RepID=A0A0A9E905_ARUDO
MCLAAFCGAEEGKMGLLVLNGMHNSLRVEMLSSGSQLPIEGPLLELERPPVFPAQPASSSPSSIVSSGLLITFCSASVN